MLEAQRTRPGKKSRPEPVMEPMTAADGVDFEIIELLFFAYRAFTSDPDAILEKGDMGRAHHRVLHFVNREPGMTVAALLDTLKITKQSLARVLKQLIDKGYICQIAGPEDRRQRCLYPTRAGRDLALELSTPQHRRIARALASATAQERAEIVRFLTRLSVEDEGGEA
ncbi:MarR family winged helix-turn-helix transcriptional regulator [Rhizobium sp. C1]|uniref:MarR family winged helix-turn-helix transcriptional regulator n=1 Tax=Rhizobium sp. C1 TaxID=1349799 RepID=UPI001E31BDE9|nr:MarR family transcriptional regulator [Rhizobium sp. C1]MCD2176382.1 MarR family transcriptional regulator [Rhizobium sp. C1]